MPVKPYMQIHSLDVDLQAIITPFLITFGIDIL